MEEYTPLMSKSTESTFGKVIQFGTIFAEVSPAVRKPEGC